MFASVKRYENAVIASKSSPERIINVFDPNYLHPVTNATKITFSE
jgi:hypothetical protein